MWWYVLTPLACCVMAALTWFTIPLMRRVLEDPGIRRDRDPMRFCLSATWILFALMIVVRGLET